MSSGVEYGMEEVVLWVGVQGFRIFSPSPLSVNQLGNLERNRCTNLLLKFNFSNVLLELFFKYS